MVRGRVLDGLIDALKAGRLDLGDEAADIERILRLVSKRYPLTEGSGLPQVRG
jgi:hypothetical protein